jgi:hypothetical protein
MSGKLLTEIDVWIGARPVRRMGTTKGGFSRFVTRPGRDDGVQSMSPPNLPSGDSLPPADLVRVIAACERFEAGWNAGRPRPIEDEMAEADGTIRTRLFRELLALELELIRRDGRSADLHAYRARFPDHGDTVREVFASETVTAPYPEVTDPGMSDDSASSAEGYELLRKLGEGGQATT